MLRLQQYMRLQALINGKQLRPTRKKVSVNVHRKQANSSFFLRHPCVPSNGHLQLTPPRITSRTFHTSLNARNEATDDKAASGSAEKGKDEPFPAVPFPHEPLPDVPLIVTPEEYLVYTPSKAAFWPCVGMFCPGKNHKKWVIIDNSAYFPANSSSSDSDIQNWINLEPSTGSKEPPASTTAEKVQSETSKADSGSTSTPSEDKSSSETSTNTRRPLIWALYTQQAPPEAATNQPFGNLHQTAPLEVDLRVVTHMRRAYVCPTTGNLEIPKIVPGKERYSLQFVWPTSTPETAPSITLADASSSSTDPNIVDEPQAATPTPQASKPAPEEPMVIGTSFESLVESDFDVSIASMSEQAETLKSEPAPSYTGPESSIVWPVEARLRDTMEKIQDVLNDVVGGSRAVAAVMAVVNWKASTAIEVSAELDRITWLLNDVTGIGEQFSRMTEAENVIWRARFVISILKTRFVINRFGYTSSERRKHMESLLSGLNETSAKSEARQTMERYRRMAESLPETVRNDVLQMINRIQLSGTPELSTNKRIFDFIFELPWTKASQDVFDMKKAREVLDKNHYGMEDVKSRVIELLAVNQLTGKFAKGKVLALLGPPGTGKTTIASSIAEALGRSFGQISVGGLWDISDLKGHRRTYLASMAGQLLRTINQCKTNNPVILLDEIDKLAHGSQVATALLEILDPAQQSSYTDVWIDLPFDISNVLFVCTANWEEGIHPALRDRLEVVTMEGYLEEEKFEISKRHLVPKCMKNAGLTDKQFSITDGAIKALVKHYSPLSPGVRDLETQIQTIVNGCSLDIARSTLPTPPTHHLTVKDYEHWLPRSEFHRFEHESTPTHPGCASALTQLGVQQIEAVTYAPKEQFGSFHTTGNLDEVLKESAHLAYTFLTDVLQKSGLEASDFFSTRSVHLHMPKGGQSKGGVHAGACVALSLLSLALNKPVPQGWAVSGELTLLGRVLPISHLKRMIHAAHLHRIKKVILPEDNRVHWNELPDSLKQGIEPHFVTWFHDIAKLIFKTNLPKPNEVPKPKRVAKSSTSTSTGSEGKKASKVENKEPTATTKPTRAAKLKKAVLETPTPSL